MYKVTVQWRDAGLPRWMFTCGNFSMPSEHGSQYRFTNVVFLVDSGDFGRRQVILPGEVIRYILIEEVAK